MSVSITGIENLIVQCFSFSEIPYVKEQKYNPEEMPGDGGSHKIIRQVWVMNFSQKISETPIE